MKLDPALNTAPSHPESVYLMGIGGVAMGALAGGLAAQGLEVRGSDRPLYPPMSTFLADRD
ncbi:MAG: UDP-N-acetylmuramate:L-alanyl-gamma-D-glutamyl-meso-diaminopimelate ligase, partial [Desulfarculaceae bacterium]|nr:UDP-N-acetylmuramate:L-alanyl-gamma-D-glutamyl-meso-diaminopimelate ligase [Desulfarculaceae bacterium]